MWWRLRLHSARPTERGRATAEDDDGELTLRARFHIAERGWATDEADDGCPAEPVDAQLLSKIREWEAAVAGSLASALDVIGVPEPSIEQERRLLRAVVDGLSVAVAVGETTPLEAHRVLAMHVEQTAHRHRPLERAG